MLLHDYFCPDRGLNIKTKECICALVNEIREDTNKQTQKSFDLILSMLLRRVMALHKIRAIHKQGELGWCITCGYSTTDLSTNPTYPCPTLLAIEESIGQDVSYT